MRVVGLDELCYMKASMHDKECAIAMDLLLSRVIGDDCFDVQRMSNPPVWIFRFWATEEEGRAIDAMIDNVIQRELDIEYEMLVANSEEKLNEN